MAAAAQRICDPVLDNAVCPPGSVGKYCPVILDDSCATGKGQLVLSSAEPPPPEHTHLVCQFDPPYSRYFCDAKPKQGDLSFDWSAIGEAQIVGPNGYDSVEVRCVPNGGNQLQLTVTSPYGPSTSTAASVSCSGLIE